MQANEYNPDAESRIVTQGLSVTIYKDKGCNDPLGDEAVSADTVLYGKVNIDFSSSEAPTLASPNIAYKLPADQIDAPNQGPSTLYDSGNNVAGTWSIKDGVAYLKYNEDWLRAHSSNMTAHFSFDFTLADSNKGDGSQTTVSFPGVVNGVTIKTKDGNVDGNKFGASPSKEWETPKFDASDNSYTWTIRISPSTFATNLTINDEIGSNLEYVPDSFKLVDANGNQVAGTCSASIDGKKATISLGDLPKGTYYVQYKTTVSSSALSALKDNTQLENVGNKATWTWGKDGQNKSNEVSRDPQKVKYNMVSKSSSGTSDDITWTVELNTGDLKADMSNYAFSDTLGAGHSFKQGTQYEVKDASGATIASGPVDPSAKNLQVTLPSNAGKQKLTVTYHTTMDDTSSKDAVSNKAEVTPPANSVYPKGQAEAGYQPDDNETYITKKLTDSSTVEQDGYATWSSTIGFTKLSQSTDPTTIVFYDKISKQAWTGHMTFDNVVVSVDGTNQVLSKDTDYALTKDGQYSEIEITFKNTDLVKSLLGANGHDVIVSYRTHCDIANDVYTNTSSLKVNNVDKGSASDSYTIDKAVIPEVSKWVGGTWWDANYSWGEGEAKGAWITSWNVTVNKTSKSGKAVAAADLKGQPIVVEDAMDKGMVYVDGSAGYNLIADNNSLSKWQQDFKNSGSVSSQDGKTEFTIPTDAVTTAEGSTKAYAELWYRTAVKPSSVEAGASKDFSNTAEAKSGETVFPSATSKTTVTNNVLEKTSTRAADDSHVTYTIKVNPNALDLNPNSDSLTLTDVMDSGCSFTNGSLRVTQNGNDITSSISYSLENTQGDNGAAATKLTLTVPDSTSLVITYDVAPQGALDDEVVINNTVSLNGFTNVVVPTSGKWRVQESNAGTEAQSYGITVRKTDDTGKMPLEGAQFSLYKVDLDKSTASNLVTESVNGNVDVETNLFGVASFGSKDQPLDANVLYYYVETKAPSGYEITNPNPTYVMFSGTSAQDKKDYAAALKKAQALGINPSAGTSFSVYDKKKDETQLTGSATLSVVKQVNGEAPAEGQTFDFVLSRDGADANSAEAPLPEQCTATTNGSASASFGAIEFTKDDIGKTYHYVITETSNLGDGWTKADPVKVTVSVGEPSSDNLASIPVSVSYGGNNAASKDGAALFNNTYREVGGSFSLALEKSVEGKSLDRSFDFAVEAVGENADSAPRLERSTVSSDENGNASFGAAKLTADNKGKTYTYKISETSSLGAGWTKAADVYAKVVVSDSLNNEGDYWATVSYSANEDGSASYSGPAQFVNKYQQASGSFSLDLAKTVNGKPENVSGFKFKATSKDEGAPSFDEQATDAEGKASFKFDGLDDSYEGKEFTYTISEDLENGKGWTKAADVVAKIQIGQRGDDNKFHPTVTYEGSPSGSVATFNNTYTATGSAVLSVAKKVNGNDPDSDEEFEFALGSETHDAPLPSVTTCKTIGSNAASFGEISYSLSDAGKTYEYRIQETTPATVGWTMAGDVIARVTVGADNGDGTLKPSTVEYVKDDAEQTSASVDAQNSAALFNNQYQQASGKFQLGLTKTVNGSIPLQGETFEFSATSSDEGAPAFNNATTDENGEAKLAEATLSDNDEGKTYTYRIHEVSDLTDGSGSWTKAPDVIATVQVSNRSDSNKLTATVTYKQDSAEARSSESAAVFDNGYQSESVSAPIEISKTVNGGALLAGESFTFQLTDNDGKQIGEEKTISGSDAEAKATFTTPDLTEPGEYTYWVKESSSPGENWTNDEPIKVVVKVGTVGKRDLKIESVEYFRGTEELSAAVFNNTHADEKAEAVLKVSKTVNGAKDENLQKQFEFQLQPKNNAPMPEGFDKATVTGTSSASFGKIVYDKTGTYNYVIHESNNPGSGWKNADDVDATVEVGYAENGRDLVVKSIEYNNQKTDAAAFDNTYEATGQATLSVKKQVNGKDPLAEEKFQFALAGQNGAPMPAEGATCETVGNTLAQFGSIPFMLADAGKTYTYTISEVSQGGSEWKMAEPVTATVTVGQDNGDGTLGASTVTYSVSAANGEAALFNNTYTANTQVTLGIHKTVQGSTDKVKDESFDFELHKADEQGNMTGEVIGTVSAKANETKNFNPISYTTADAGKTFTYWIYEVGHNDKGWTADKDVKVTVKVLENADRSLATEVTYSRGTSAAEFTNTYATSGQATLSVLKTVNGGTDEGVGQKFHFDLYNADDQGNAQREKIGSVETGVGEKASFDAISLSGEGTHHYVIKEVGYNDGAWFAAGDVVATVTATDNGDGTLNVTVEYSNADGQQDAALFDNAYAPVTANIQVKKTVNGEKAPADTHFTFELQPQDGAPMPEEATADTFGGDTCSFGSIEYSLSGTYGYVIHETANLGEGWTNAADVPVTVKVVRDEDARTLKVESVDYGDSVYAEDGQTMALFDNKYAPSQPEGPGNNTPEQQQPAGGVASDSQAASNDVKAAGVKTGDNLMVVGGAIAVVAVAAAAIAAFALRRRKH